MRTYYWENPVGLSPDCGRLDAVNDDAALALMPETAICMYRENESTEDGIPFIMVYEATPE
jgi:hypothetical protein